MDIKTNGRGSTFRLQGSIEPWQLLSLSQAIEEHGFCHVRCEDPDHVEDLLLDAQQSLGSIMHHDRSKPNGLVPIQHKPEIPKAERLISDSAGDAVAHTDGAFMEAPPRVIALGIIELAESAPETYTIDCAPILDRLPDSACLLYTSDAADD